jgi:hypothetical protein
MGAEEAKKEPDDIGLGDGVGRRAAIPLPYQPSPLGHLGHKSISNTLATR